MGLFLEMTYRLSNYFVDSLARRTGQTEIYYPESK